ncbi:MAG: hypothetical protein ACBZ72_04740 [Candidatus Bathyarchaeia archaeon]
MCPAEGDPAKARAALHGIVPCFHVLIEEINGFSTAILYFEVKKNLRNQPKMTPRAEKTMDTQSVSVLITGVSSGYAFFGCFG